MTTKSERSYLGYVLMRSAQSAETLRAIIGAKAAAMETKYQADMRRASRRVQSAKRRGR